MSAHLRSKKNPTKGLIVPIGCKGWASCPECAARKLLACGRHIAGKLLLAPEGVEFFEMLSEANPDGNNKKWETERKKLKRHGASYVRLGPMHLPGVTFGIAPSRFGKSFGDREAAVVRLGEVLRQMATEVPEWGKRCRPVNYSQDWTPPESDQKGTHELLGRLCVKHPSGFVKTLNELGAKAEALQSDDGVVVRYTIPPALDEFDSMKIDHQLDYQLRCPT